MKIRFAVIGLGYVSGRHLDGICKNPDAELVAVCDVDAGRVKAASSKYRVPGFADCVAMFNAVACDAVCICTPSGYHKDVALKAAAHGKHAIIEKPMTLTVADTQEVIDAFSRKGLALTTMFQNRLNAPIRMLKELITTGKTGKPLYINAAARWYRSDEYYQDGWHGKKSVDGGTLLNQGIHYLDIVLYLMGKQPTRVQAITANLMHDIEFEDFALITMEFPGGEVACVEVSTIAYPSNLEGSLVFMGERGSALINGNSMNRISQWRFDGFMPLMDAQSELENPVYLQIDNFVNHILGREPLLVKPAEVLLVQKVIEQAYESARKKEVILHEGV